MKIALTLLVVGALMNVAHASCKSDGWKRITLEVGESDQAIFFPKKIGHNKLLINQTQYSRPAGYYSLCYTHAGSGSTPLEWNCWHEQDLSVVQNKRGNYQPHEHILWAGDTKVGFLIDIHAYPSKYQMPQLPNGDFVPSVSLEYKLCIDD